MGVVTKPRCTVVFLMILTLGMSLGLPAEDVLDAVYDESEALSFEGTPVFSIVVPLQSPRTTPAMPSPLDSGLAPSPFLPARVRESEAKRATHTRISLALLCTLLC